MLRRMFPVSEWAVPLMVIALSSGCGGETPTTAPETTSPTVDLGSPAESPAATPDMAPVLPIPEDAPGADASTSAPPIKPIPDEPGTEMPQPSETPNQ